MHWLIPLLFFAYSLGAWAKVTTCEYELRMPLDPGAQTSLVTKSNSGPWSRVELLELDPLTVFRGVELTLSAHPAEGVRPLLDWFRNLGVRHLARAYEYQVEELDGEKTKLGLVLDLRGPARKMDKEQHELVTDTLMIPGEALLSDAALVAFLSAQKELVSNQNRARLNPFNPATIAKLEAAFADYGIRAQELFDSENNGLAYEGKIVEVKKSKDWRETAVAVHEIEHALSEHRVVADQSLANVGRMIWFSVADKLDILAKESHPYRRGFRFDEVEAYRESAKFTERYSGKEAAGYYARARDFAGSQAFVMRKALDELLAGTTTWRDLDRDTRLGKVEVNFSFGSLRVYLPRAGLGAWGGSVNRYLDAVLRARITAALTEYAKLGESRRALRTRIKGIPLPE